MIVERYFEWVESAPAALRAEAAGALARTYRHGDLDAALRAEIEGALIRSLDDPHLPVRCAIADALASCGAASPSLILTLAHDAPDVAEPVLARSPLLSDMELVDMVALGGDRAQIAVARRRAVSAPLAAAVAEIGCAGACAALLANAGAVLTAASAARIAQRHGADAEVRERLVARDDVGPEIRHMLMRAVARSLEVFVSDRGWLAPDRARRASDEACERGAVAIAAQGAPNLRGFVEHLVARGEFAPSLALRALLCGDSGLFEAALSVLSGQPAQRVAGFVRDFDGRGFEAVYAQAGFPAAALPAFRAALSAEREFGRPEGAGASAELSRRRVERALTACDGGVDAGPLRAMLRRFQTDAMRAEARRAFERKAIEAPRAA
ncbi:hypothetical protein GCM10008171_06830 [Methylopila jiangsuensis]|uniref:DUF2336 domain-containing protein n=1 Tax=Methylopila jiangsuensis TaxID=586230 RepID=A0A9W6N203_9HYPH|nr:DUF2336 domain-containing protein [Methylopila jiangsuensis]MDR6285669.1 uncharacterized protein (DUF2336 family) [Methylopila jiangsuensis]GLK75429.1 hypothetical protein GCM10008171_06830 [Methylopila jiangsuensis]